MSASVIVSREKLIAGILYRIVRLSVDELYAIHEACCVLEERHPPLTLDQSEQPDANAGAN